MRRITDPAERRRLLKVAFDDSFPLEDENPDLFREIDQNDDLIPQSVWPLLTRTFTLRGVGFFRFYIELKRIDLGQPVNGRDLKREYTTHINKLAQITSPFDHRPVSPEIINRLAESRSDLSTLFGRLMAGRTENSATWRRINDIYVPLILMLAKDKGIYFGVRQTGTERWGIFRRMNQQQEATEKLRDENPESYALVQKYHQTLTQIDAGIEQRILDAKLQPVKAFIAGKPVLIGRNPDTGEENVFDIDGEVLPKQDFIEKRRQRSDAESRLYRTGNRTTVTGEIRFISDEKLEQLAGPVEWSALTDDKAKQGRLTRVFTTKWMPQFISGPDGLRVESVKVITSGRFKGAYLDDMVNAEGRLVEGTAYTYNPGTGRTANVPVRIDPAQREPYVTVSETVVTLKAKGKTVKRKEQRLYIKIPGTRNYTEIRKALKSLSCNAPAVSHKGCIPSLVYQSVSGSNAAAFTFEPKDFAAVMDAVQGMSLSSAALDLIRTYYKDLSRADQATADRNLAMYTPETLGGFKTHKKDPVSGEMRPVTLLTLQKKALAWLDANGNRGACAPDTGVGKTLISVAMMQKLIRDGLAETDAVYQRPDGQEVQTNGRYLYVCPPPLKGNFAKEVRGFISDARALLDRVDVISYREFGGSGKTGKVPRSLSSVSHWKGRDWDPSAYIAIFFDEAHLLTKLSSSASAAALQLWHPRKVCLTASPMEDNPMQAYVLAAISNNTPLYGRDPRALENRKEMLRFKERFCEVVGGHIVGVKQDVATKRDLQTWVKRNIFYADKTEVQEEHAAVPALQTSTQVVEMEPEVESIYRATASRFTNILGGLVSRYAYKGKAPTGAPSPRDPEIEKFFTLSFTPVLRVLNGLANYPAETMQELAGMLETGNMPGGDKNGMPRPVPKALIPLLENLRRSFSPEQLRTTASTTRNPKLQAAEEFIRRKLERSKGASRTLVFSDDRRMCLMAARHLASTMAGWHVLALSDTIDVLEGSQYVPDIWFEITPDLLEKTVPDQDEQMRIMQQTGGWSTLKFPLKKHAYRRYPMLPARDPDNTHYRADHWQQFVFKEIITPNTNIKSCVLYGPSYSHGQNLQAFDTVLHLDRDTWDSEAMKQRTARAWRQGQANPVDEVTIDATYGASQGGVPRDEFDKTLDEVRRLIQQVDGEIFSQIIRESQQLALGKEWLDVLQHSASRYHLDRKILELMTSPYVGKSEPPGA